MGAKLEQLNYTVLLGNNLFEEIITRIENTELRIYTTTRGRTYLVDKNLELWIIFFNILFWGKVLKVD